jgi:hypothetical protein
MGNQELTTRNNDGFAVAERGGTNLIKGIIIKFADGVWKQNKTEPLQQGPKGPTFAVVGVVTAWVHWKGGKPIEHLITQPGQAHPWREDFGDLDESEWELGIGGLPSNPWKDTRYLYLVDPRTGKTYTYITDTHGGRQAVGELKDAIANVRRAQPGALPVVQLATTTMPTRFGVKPRPDLTIIEWRGGTSTSPAEAQQQIEHQGADADESDIPFDDNVSF